LGAQLITIFEDEWLNKQDICLSRLNAVFKVKQQMNYARKCSVKLINNSQAIQFLSEHHLQGAMSSKINIGMFQNDELIAVMTAGKPRYDKDIDLEIHRFCSSKPIIGGAQKLFAFLIRNFNPKTIVSYADLRWGTGNIYLDLGFSFQKTTKPGYFYTDKKIRYHRSKFTKKQLIAKGFDNRLTEHEIMRSLGYARIWDCGHNKFLWGIDKPVK
jgi:hypothetical protein